MTTTWRQIQFVAISGVFLLSAASTAIASPPREMKSGESAEELLLQAAHADSGACSRYRARSWLREKIIRDSDYARYGLQLSEDCKLTADDQRLVVLIHGFNSSPVQNAALMKSIRETGLLCATFAYPNDHTIPASAQLLANDLCRFSRQYPQCRVTLVCHSMGGLVARMCIEDPLYDPGNVERLIMIAPPTHGTLIAHFAVATDLWEHWLSRTDGGPWRRARDSIVDGLGEAADDLCPNSTFLHELNSRPRNPRVQYSNFLGTSARFEEAQLAWMRQSLCNQLSKMPGGTSSAEKLEAILSDIDELVDGKGDGVVAVKRGRLEGVSDTVVLPFGHVAVTGEPGSDELRHVRQAVLQRLQ